MPPTDVTNNSTPTVKPLPKDRERLSAMASDVSATVKDDAHDARLGFDRFRHSGAKKNDALEHTANTSMQVFGAGNTQEATDLVPATAIKVARKGRLKFGEYAVRNADKETRVARSAGFLHNFGTEHPDALERLKLAGRLAGPVLATVSTAISAFTLRSQWKTLSPGAKILNVGATGFTAVGAGAAFAALSKAPWAAGAGTLAWGSLGAAGAIYQGITTFRYFNDPTKTSGQRDLSLISTVLQGAGAALVFTPFGMPLLVAGGLIGMASSFLGKWKPVNDAFKWVDKAVGPTAKAIFEPIKSFAGGAINAGKAVGHFFSSL